jgi:hypothetical protein
MYIYRAKTNASESVDRKKLATLSLAAKNSAKEALLVLQEMTSAYSFKNEVKGFITPGIHMHIYVCVCVHICICMQLYVYLSIYCMYIYI